MDRWWTAQPCSVLLATGAAFDVIDAPAHLGWNVSRRGRLGPVAVTPAGRWLFFVRTGDALRPELDNRLDIVLHSNGSWVPAPPTPTPIGPLRWVTHPADTGWTLPDSYAVQRVLDTCDVW